MSLPAPKLDDRTFQDIVDEAKKRIPHFCKEWTDHNVSDPGITLIELFAWMTEIILYRMNQVPDLHYAKFMDMLGIKLKEPEPATCPVTFWLSAPQEIGILIPAGTEVASTQTETEQAIVFTTVENFSVLVPQLAEALSRISARDGSRRYDEHNLRRLEAGFEGVEIFSRLPTEGDALFFGFENDLTNHIIGFDVDCDPAGGAGIDPTLPPYVWEASTGGAENVRWQPCEIDSDNTKGMNSTGRILIYVPKMGKYRVNNKERYWIRVRVKEISSDEMEEGMLPYQVSPRVRQIRVASWGGTTEAVHAQRIHKEFLGRSDGSAGQRFFLQMTPLLKRQPGEHLTVQAEGEKPQVWREVDDFSKTGSTDKVYVLDSITGELRFAPAIRQQDGTIKLYGAIPTRNANLIFEGYRFGGGQEGNVQPNHLNTLKTSIPYIGRVENRKPAFGGLDSESMESAMMRAPALMQSRERAVTEDDFEFLAREAIPAAISRVKCIQPKPSEVGRIVPGQIYVLVIPRVLYPPGYLDPVELRPHDADISKLQKYLDERRLLTARLSIQAPAYHWVAVKVQLRAAPGANQTAVETELLNRLYRFLNPLTGGQDGKGWPFGRDLYISDVYQCLQGAPNVLFVRAVEMYTAAEGGAPQSGALEVVNVVAHGVIASGVHQIEFV
ncbi:MAG: putative baseplate assembly protein [Chloroflexi bacterium]|nr:putative baseplate assembly protein [Chloroflexota bacterium]MBP8056374.1 putative baseplate assembly protein [Chloroflexota bacterium]